MRIELKPEGIVLVPESDADRSELALWKSAHGDFVFAAIENSGPGVLLQALGPRAEACREPINVTSDSPDPQVRLIANFAATPFILDGAWYASVEAFWQSLRFPPAERARIAKMDGRTAKRESDKRPYGTHVEYQGRAIAVGTFDHWELMRRACLAKFTQNADAGTALLATGERPLIHVVRRDSRTIPGVIMASIWMDLREDLRSERR